MSPLSLVGILVITSSAFADVKHVLEGSAHPPEPNAISPEAVNYLASNPPGEFWWMNSDSPLKAAYDYYKKCNAKGNCLAPVNPNAPAPQPFRPQETVNINIKKNPFLNGDFKPSDGNSQFNNGGSSTIDISKNPFLSGAVVTTGNGAPVVKGQDGFIGVQPVQPFGKKSGFATTHPLEEQKKPFANNHPLEKEEECKGLGFACVEKELCVNGVVNKHGEGLLQVRSDVHRCGRHQACCQLAKFVEITAGKSSVPIKLAAANAGDSPIIRPEIFLAGEHGHHGSSTPKTIRDTSVRPNSVFSSTIDYSNTRFDDDVRFASTFQGPAYLPPVGPTPTTKPPPRPFETKTPSINQQFVSKPSTPKYVPPLTTPRPTPPTFRPAPSTSREYLPPSQPTPGLTSTQYVPPQTTSRPYQPPQTTSRPYQPPQTTSRPYQPPQTTSRPYQPPYQPQQTTFRPYQPSQTTSRPYQPPYQPQQTTSRPYQPSQTTSRPYQPPYQPSQTTSRPYQPPYQPAQTTSRPYQPPQITSRPPPPYQPPQTTSRPYQPPQTTSKPYQPPQTTPKPYQPPYQPPQTLRPYQPPQTTLRPFQPSQTTSRPYQPPYQPSTLRPSTSGSQYLPPRPSTPFVPQPSSPRPNPFIPQQTTPRPSSYQPSSPSPPKFRPTPPPFQPGPTSPPVTPGYQYPTPSPSKPRPTPSPQYPSPSQPTFRPTSPPFQPRPTPSPQYPSPSQPQPTPFQPRPSPGASTGYQYPTPSPSRPTPSPQYPSPSQPPFRPTSPPFQPRPTPSPQYPSPSQPQPRPTPSPQYPSPSQPPFRPTSPPFQPRPTPSPQYPSPSQPQPRPTSSPQYPSPSQPPFRPTSPPFQPRPTPSPQYPSPSQPQPRPTPSPQYPSPSQPQYPSTGYQYPTPSPSRPNPFIPQQPSTPLRPGPSVINPQFSTSTSFVQPSTPSRPSSLRPYQPPITTQRPYQPPITPQKPYQPSVTPQRPYQPPSTSQRPYQPPVTQKPYVPPQTGGYEYPKPTPTFGYPTTPKQDTSGSNINNQYVQKPTTKRPTTGYLPPSVPQNPDQSGEGSSNVNSGLVPKPPPRIPQPSFNGELNTAPPPGCAAALKCVQEIYCTAEGVISPVPVVLTKQQEENRVPTTVCQDTESGIIGKCCRDPNYKDPWPSANLVDGIDDGQYKEDDSIGQYQQDLQRNVRSDKGGPRQDLSSPRNNNFQATQPTCGERHRNSNPPGPGPLDVDFAEIPWQAMVLRDSNRSLLCGGVIIRRDAVLTAAHCVEGLETSDILIKGGEWKLGIDEEPLPFQIVKVAVVVRHPQYQPGSLLNDLALLVLEEKLRPSKNVGTICLPPPNQIPTENCIATGWGKRILQLHAKGAIMHSIDVKIMDNGQCQETLASKFQHAVTNYSPNTLCGYSNIDQCRVDYGSALACSDGSHYVLSGIYAWDTGCKQEGQIGGYVAPDVEWIESTLTKPIRELKKLEQRN